MAGFFGCSVDTLTDRFSEVIHKGRQQGKMKLRRIQWQHAEKSPAMAIFLGKNLLDQKDAPDPIQSDTSRGDQICLELLDRILARNQPAKP